MKENFLHFLSGVPARISVNGADLGIIDNLNTFEHDIITKTDRIFVEYLPVSGKENLIPYLATISTNGTPLSENKYIEVVPFPNNNYDITLKPFYYYELRDAKVVLNKAIGNYFVSIVSTTNTSVTIFSGATIVFKSSLPLITNATAEEKGDMIIIKGVISDTEYYLLVINTKSFEVIYSDIFHSIEETDGYIEILKYLHNLPRHAVVCKLEFKPYKKEIFYVYEKDCIVPPKPKYFVPLYFLDALKVGDEKACKSVLAPSILTSPISKFKHYFGEMKCIHLNRHSIKPEVNITIKTDTYKNYNFFINDGKIEDIEEVILN